MRVTLSVNEHKTLQMMLEQENGQPASLDQCSSISTYISSLLDVEDIIHGEYTLEVSSPGLERPLVKPDDYKKYAGRKVSVKLSKDIDGRKKFKGVLKGITENQVQVDIEETVDKYLEAVELKL